MTVKYGTTVPYKVFSVPRSPGEWINLTSGHLAGAIFCALSPKISGVRGAIDTLFLNTYIDYYLFMYYRLGNPCSTKYDFIEFITTVWVFLSENVNLPLMSSADFKKEACLIVSLNIQDMALWDFFLGKEPPATEEKVFDAFPSSE